MILLTIQDGGNPRLGVKTARGVIDVAAAQAALGQRDDRLPQTVEAAIAGGEATRPALPILSLASRPRMRPAHPGCGTKRP